MKPFQATAVEPVRDERPGADWQRVYLPLLAVQVLFSTLPVAAKLTFVSFPPAALAIYRIAGTALFFFLVFRFFFHEKIKQPGHYLQFAVLSLLGVTGNQLLFLKGLSLTSAANASLLMASIPIFTLLAAVVLGHEKFSLFKALGVAIALSGVFILLDLPAAGSGGSFSGNLLIVGNAFLYSLYLVLSRPLLAVYRALTVMTYTFVFGFLTALPFTLGPALAVDYRSIPALNYLAPAYAIVMGTCLPYIINAFALKRGSSSLAAIFTYIQPLLGSLFPVLLLGERISLKMILAGLLILGGVTVAAFSRVFRRNGSIQGFFRARRQS